MKDFGAALFPALHLSKAPGKHSERHIPMKCIADAVEGMLPTARERRVCVPHRCTGQQAKGMDRPNGNEKGIKISELTSQSSLPSPLPMCLFTSQLCNNFLT